MVRMRLGIVIGLLVFCGWVQGCIEPDRYMTDAEQSGQGDSKEGSREVQKDHSQRPSRTTSSPGTTGSY